MTVTDLNGCTDIDQMTVVVNQLPMVDAGIDREICAGDNTILGGNPTGPTGSTYQWDNISTLDNATLANPTATPTVTTTYTVIVNDLNGCTSSNQVAVTVNPLPIADAGPDRAICEGESTVLGSIALPAVNYNWDNASTLDNASKALPVANPTLTTTYTVTLTDLKGCTSTDQVTVNVNLAPDVDAGSDFTICKEDTIQIGGSPTSNAIGASYNWSNASTLLLNSVSNPFAFPDDTTKYYVTVTDGLGCSSVDSMIVNVNPLPDVDFRIDASCLGDFTAFTDETSITAGGFNLWEWDFGDGFGTSNLQNPAYQYSNAGAYNVTLSVTSLRGCKTSITKEITINPLPLADAGPDQSICFGDTIQIGGDPTGSTSSTFSWDPGFDISSVTSQNPFVYPLSTMEYSLSVTDQNLCINYDTVMIVVNSLPNIVAEKDTFVCVKDSVQLSVSGAVFYSWSPPQWLNDPQSSTPIANPLRNIEYIVTGADQNGCIDRDTVFISTFNVEFIPPDTSVCAGDSVQLVPIIQGNELGINYLWSPANGLNGTQIRSPKSSPLVDQKYFLQITNSSGCSDIDSVTVTVNDTVVLDFNFVNSPRCVGSVLEVQNNSTLSNNYRWKLNGKVVSTETNPRIPIDPTMDNIITLIGANSSCSDSIQKTVASRTLAELLNFNGVNVFSPNGDGVNDVFNPGIIGEFRGCIQFKIFDRWGSKVFDAENGQYTWEGRTLNGKMASGGVYYYVIDIGSEEIRGSVFLSR